MTACSGWALLVAGEVGATYPADVDIQLDLAARAEQAARRAGDDQLLARIALQRAEIGVIGRRDDPVVTLLDDAIHGIRDGHPGLRARLLAMRAFHTVVFEAEGHTASEQIDAAIALARSTDDPVVLAEVLTSCSYVLLGGPDLDRRQSMVAEVQSIVPELPARAAARAQTNADRIDATIALQLADRERFERAKARVTAWQERWNRVVLTKVTLMWTALTSALDGDPARSEKEAFELLATSGTDLNFVLSASQLVVNSHRWRGQQPEIARQARNVADEQPTLALARAVASTHSALVGELDEARRCLDPLLRRADPIDRDTTMSGQLAAIVEACVLTDRPVPVPVAALLEAYAGQLIVLAGCRHRRCRRSLPRPVRRAARRPRRARRRGSTAPRRSSADCPKDCGCAPGPGATPSSATSRCPRSRRRSGVCTPSSQHCDAPVRPDEPARRRDHVT